MTKCTFLTACRTFRAEKSDRLLALLCYVCIMGLATMTGPGMAWATDYFISSMGSDTNNGQSGTVVPGKMGVGPFATLEPLSKLDLKHGDRIFLACGQEFLGPVRLRLNGKLPGMLEIGRYGDCPVDQRPTVHGRVPLTASFRGMQAIKQATPVAQVFSGDSPLARARFPKQGYLLFPSETASTFDRIPPHPALLGRKLNGSVVHARTQEWYIERKRVVSETGNLESPLRYPLRPKAGLYLSGKSWMIGEDEGWAFDHASQTLNISTKRTNPITVVHEGHLLQIEGRGAVAIKGIAFDAAGTDAINLKVDGVVNISDVSITRAAGNGISIAGARFAQITHSYIEDTGLDGIFFAEVARAVVRNNVVTNAGLFLGPGPSLAAINAHRTDAATVEENQVRNAAYIGIRFSGDARIRGNIVESACLLLSDCGAIYTWRRGQHDQRSPVEVSGNVIIHVKGDTTVKFGVNDWFAGIYLDEWTRSANVSQNLVVNAGQGVYLHNARNNLVNDNFVIGARHKSFIEKDSAHALLVGQARNQEIPNVFTDNTALDKNTQWFLRRNRTEEAIAQDLDFTRGNIDQSQLDNLHKRVVLGGKQDSTASFELFFLEK